MRKMFILINCLSLFTISSCRCGANNYDEGDVYYINNDADIYAIRGNLSGHYKLAADIDLSVNYSAGWTPIGTDSAPFTGTFDGDNHTISNLTISSSGDYQGLFGYISGATIQNLNLTGVSVAGGSYVGALAGYSDSSTISSCSIAGTLITGNGHVGGLLGFNTGILSYCSGNVPVTADFNAGGLIGTNNGEIRYSNVSDSASVQGRLYVGGLIGVNNSTATVNHCYAVNTVTGVSTPYDTGGLIGRNFADITICYATGNVSGYINVGALIGLNASSAVVTYCYATGNTSGSLRVGGFIGEIQSGCVVNYCYGTGLANSGSSGGLIGALNGTSCTVTNSYCNSANTDNGYGTGTSLSNMQLQSTFSGWDFSAIWGINGAINNGYPYLINIAP